jgi:hypothetical protein
LGGASAPDLPFVAGGGSGYGTVEETVARTSLPASQRGAQEYVAPAPQEEEPKPSPWRFVAPILGVAALVAIGILLFNLQPWNQQGDDDGLPITQPGGSGDQLPDDVVPGYVAPPNQVKAEADGDQVVVTWKAPESFEEGDEFAYRVRSLTNENVQYKSVGAKTTVTVPREAGDTCVDVVTLRDNNPSRPEGQCVTAEGTGG